MWLPVPSTFETVMAGCLSEPASGLVWKLVVFMLVFSHVVNSEVEADLTAEDEGIVNSPCAAGIDHVLNVRLEKNGALAKIRTVGQFQNQFVVLRADGRIKQLLALLGVTQVAAKIAVSDTEASHIRWSRRKEAPSYDAGGEKIRHLTD